MTYAVEYEEGVPATEFAAADDCLALAHRLHDSARLERPLGAHIYRPDGESLFVVLGAEVSCMGWFPANYSDRAVGSLSSDANVTLEEPLDYWFCGHHGQVCPDNAVAITTALSALEQFLQFGGQPGAVNWIAD